MHLHWLKIKNIASLFGDHTIDFDELTSQDLFAITGETGAGKSSILNAISLALYGNVYKKQLNQSDLVSLGEREASVDICFSAKSKKYQASWSARVKKKDGSPLSPPKVNRFFYEIKGDELQLMDSKQKPEDVLSLDFDQFCKCVILNQGDFAKFLASNFSERRDILEKLYPSDNLELVGGIAKKRWLEIQEELGRLEIQIHTLQGESVFDIQSIKAQKNKLQVEIDALQEKLKLLRPGIQIFETLKEQSLKCLQTQIKKSEAEKAQMDRTTFFNGALNRMNTFKEEIDRFQSSFEKNFEKLSADEKSYQSLLREKTRLEQITERIKLTEIKLKRDEAKGLSLETEIKKLNTHLTELKINVPTFSQYESIDWKILDRVLYELPSMRTLKLNQVSELNEISIKGKALSQSLEELKQQRDTIALSAMSFRERSLEIDRWQEKKTLQKSSQERSEILTKKIAEIDAQLPSLLRRLEELKVLKVGQHLQHLVNTMREHLKSHPQDDCPLCQQLLPPEFSQLMEREASPLGENDYEKLFQFEEKKWAQLETQKESLESELKTIPPLDLGLKKKISDLQTQHNELMELEKRQEMLERQIKEAREVYKNLKAKSDKHDLESKVLEDYYEKLIHNLSSHSEGGSFFEFLEKIKKDAELSRIKNEKEQTLKAFQIQLSQLQKETKEERQALIEISEKKDQEHALFSKEWELFQKLYPEGDSPEIRLKKLREEQKQIFLQEQVIQVDLRQKERELSDARSHTQRIMDQLKQIELLFSQELNKISQHLELDIKIEEASQILDPFIEERKNQIAQLEKSVQDATTQVGFLSRQIEDDKERSQKLDHLKVSLKKFHTENQRWKRVLDVLGQDDMRTFVLSLVELALIKQTNFELSKLIHGRYEILQNQKKGKLTPEFLVVDHWSDGLVRKVSTLSGGETFMVSLAMALALAEMARGRADIDSFFIDEGFGTLDEDSLEDVVGMLQQVRSRGKQIGLITHVKNLSQRLPVNLQVIKNDRGHSHTNVLYH